MTSLEWFTWYVAAPVDAAAVIFTALVLLRWLIDPPDRHVSKPRTLTAEQEKQRAEMERNSPGWDWQLFSGTADDAPGRPTRPQDGPGV